MNLCPACDRPLPLARKGRRLWCSSACRAWARVHPGEKRQARRTCAACGIDISHKAYKAIACSPRCRDIARGLVRAEPLPSIDCIVCDGGFVPRQANAKYCSRECKNRRPRDRSGESGRSQPSYRGRTCEVCGGTYDTTRQEQRTCSRVCGAKINARNRRLRKVSLVRAVPKWSALICPVWWQECCECGQVFAAESARQKVCSQKCRRQRANSSRRALFRACACGTQIPTRRQKCNFCLEVSRKEQRRRAKRRRRALKLGAASEDYTLAEIAARDRRTCQLCGKRVAMTKQVPHSKAPVIDHVLPLARGGDDTRANVQLAHFLCNSFKSDGGSQQLALVG